jgi:hypothetical protein
MKLLTKVVGSVGNAGRHPVRPEAPDHQETTVIKSDGPGGHSDPAGNVQHDLSGE